MEEEEASNETNASSRRGRGKELSLQEKDFGVSPATISRIVKRKDEYTGLYSRTAGGESGRKRKFRQDKHSEINRIVYQWYLQNRSQEGGVNGPEIREHALVVAKSLDLTDFKASNGWLDSFRARHNIAAQNLAAARGLPPSEEELKDAERYDKYEASSNADQLGRLMILVNQQNAKLNELVRMQCEAEAREIARSELEDQRWEFLVTALTNEETASKLPRAKYL